MNRRGSVTSESSRRRCINCSLAIPRNTLIHRVESVHENIREVLNSWVTPTMVTPEHVICHNCYLLMQEGTISSPEVGHQSVCFGCGVSLLRTSERRTYQIRPDCPQRDVILQWTPLHLVSRLERACAACWRAATRTVDRQQQHDLHRSLGSEEVLTTDERPSRITSSLYRRAASTTNHCLYMNCTGAERLTIPQETREMVLKNHRFYIPAGARICQYHLDNGHWGELTSTLTDFTTHQFDEMMSIMERLSVRNDLDFSNPSNMSPVMCHYWIGMSGDQWRQQREIVHSVQNT
ncbi:hypothetical protein ABMA27_009913 [Loxostege sticticalis]|uniref:RING-type domain-containing protein n=1 Tax=Loxostege sticticalis TaxID=481309 RepID=A0ABR3H6Z0_LOXSC